MAAVEEVLASLAYPGLAALCLFWVHVGVARWLAARRWCDALLAATAVFGSATFVLLALSTGVTAVVEFERLRLAIRLGWLVTLGLGIGLSVDFVRRQHAIFRERQ